MPTMNEIYDHHAQEYNALVDCEDHEGNLEKELLKITSFKDKTVCELGMGTGRLTKILLENKPRKVYGFDRAKGMIESAKLRHFD